MIVYPTLELSKGRCVSLVRGRLDAAEIWHVDPVATARGWAADGASWMHLTDLDWVAGTGGNDDLVQQIIRSVGIPVQLAGGFRSAEGVAHWIDRGAGRVVLSTFAAQDPDTVRSLTRSFPDQIVLSVDVWKGRVMLGGWQRESALTPEAFIQAFNDCPLAAVIITDIGADIGDTDRQLGLVSGLAATARAPVIASGIVHSVDDVARLKYVPNISGCLVGRALFQRSVDIKAALAVARPEPEPVAEFL